MGLLQLELRTKTLDGRAEGDGGGDGSRALASVSIYGLKQEPAEHLARRDTECQ